MKGVRCSLGITAHNEEANIGHLLQCVREQQLSHVELTEVIVVASGCTDGTEDIVRRLAEDDPRIRLLVQPRRTSP